MTYQNFINLALEKGFTNIQIAIETIISTEASYINKKLDDYSDINKTIYQVKAELNNKVETLYTEYLDENILNILIEKINLTDTNYQDDFIELRKVTSINHNKIVSIREEIKKVNELDNLRKDYPLIKSLELFYSDDYQETRIINSKGLDIQTSEHTYHFIAEATAEKNDSSSSFDRRILVTDKEKIDFVAIVKEVLEKATLLVTKEKLETKKYNVILDSKVATTIISNLKNMLSAQSIRKKTSCLDGKLNKKIFSPKLSIVEEPLNNNYPGYTIFDKEASFTINKTIIENGKLKTYLYDSKEAKLENIASTGNGYGQISTRNMYVTPSSASMEELLSKLDSGLYITDQMGSSGSSINEATGNISIQVFGYIVKNGKIVSGFVPAVMSTTIFELLSNIEEVGNDLAFQRKDVGTPSLYIKNISIASE